MYHIFLGFGSNDLSNIDKRKMNSVIIINSSNKIKTFSIKLGFEQLFNLGQCLRDIKIGIDFIIYII